MRWWNSTASETQITHGQRLWLYCLSTIIMCLLIIPTVIVIPMSFSDSQYLEFPPQNWSLRWYNEYIETPRSGSRLGKMLFFIMMTPMIVPVILIAIGTFYVFGKIGLVNSIIGLVLAHTVLSVPIVMIIITSALSTYDLNQERVAQSLGSTRIRAFFEITLPQLKFSVLTAALLAFLTSFDEVIISIFLSGGGNSTLTKQMFSALRDYIDPTIAAISTLMILLSTGLMLGLQMLGNKLTRQKLP